MVSASELPRWRLVAAVSTLGASCWAGSMLRSVGQPWVGYAGQNSGRRSVHQLGGLRQGRLHRMGVKVPGWDGRASSVVVPSVAMRTLGAPTPSSPVMFGAPVPPDELLPWSWAEQRLVRAQNYWIATTRPGGRPHCRPVWGVWLPDGFWFSTGSLAAHHLRRNDQITVHLEDGQRHGPRPIHRRCGPCATGSVDLPSTSPRRSSSAGTST